MSNTCDFDRILKTECNLQHFLRNCRIKNLDDPDEVDDLDDLERDEADAYLWRVDLWRVQFECEGERNNHILYYEQVFGNVFERMESGK